MQIKKQVIVDAPSDEVWKVIGEQFDQVDHWASSVHRSAARRGAGAPIGSPMAGRVCDTELGPFSETIIDYDKSNKTVAYEAAGEKMPFFVKGLRNRWTLVPLMTTSTKIDMLLSAELAFPFSLFMSPLMKIQMGRVLNVVLEDLKVYVETGKPHPRKIEMISAAKRTAA